MRRNVSSGTPWESRVGYSRAVRVGPIVTVAGTVAADERGRPVGRDAYAQTRFALEKIARALSECGASLSDVVRTRVFVTSRRHFAGAQKAHGEVFSGIRPAATMIVAAGLIDPRFCVEVEADAVLPEKRKRAMRPSVLRPEIPPVPRPALRQVRSRRRTPTEKEEES